MVTALRLVLAALLGLVLVGCSVEADRRLAAGYIEEQAGKAFYQQPNPVPPGPPGSIIRTEQLLSAPENSVAWRVMYHTTDLTGADVVATGVVVAPTGKPPEGGRTIVGWGHPTTGSAVRCAPSSGLDPFDLVEGLHDLLADGYVVAYADYPGMGTAGPNSYLVGVSEANSILDVVRAARQIPETGAGTDLLLWGHSQGGQAVLFAAQGAAAYAPELTLRAAAVAAPAADLSALLDADIGDVSGVTIGSYAFAAYQSVYAARFPRLELNTILTDAGAAATPKMAQLCLFGQNRDLHKIAGPLVGNYLKANPAATEPWATMLRENTPAATRLPVPLYVAQGESDTLVVPSVTDTFVAGQCAAGTHVIYQKFPKTGHGMIALKAVPAVSSFFESVLAYDPPASTC